ncbi:MAG: type II toxin-antitoxin system RelB/DinJ family antitoxin [Acidobacteriaceae bacterium]|nr:type II toxin-antitoxin system RelB/DinJ family antitoxin [Acidobacteriaceae bacterium]
MAANQLIQTRIDGSIKTEAAAVLAAMGLTVSDAVRLLLTRIAHDKALPFDPLTPNETTIQAMRDARAGRVTKARNLDALFRDLNEDA